MRRPSHYMLVCALLVLGTFSASGHLRIAAPEPQRTRSTQPDVVRLEAPVRPTPRARVAGSVVDTMGFLVAGAEVVAGELRQETDADGRFQLELPAQPSAELLLLANGHRPTTMRVQPLAGEAVFAALEPAAPWDGAHAAVGAAPPGYRLRGEGTVRAAGGGAVAGALVFVAETLAMARTDAAGRYEIELPTGAATLLVHAPDAADGGLAVRSEPIEQKRASGRVPLPELTAAPALVLRGVVRDGNGQPQRGVPVQVSGDGFVRTIATGDGGAFHLGGLLPGSYRVKTFAFRGALGIARDVALRDAVVVCDLQMPSATERRMQIVTEGGEPVARAMVATSVDGLRREVLRSDDLGFVHVRAAQPSAAFDVRTGDDYKPMRVVSPPQADGRLIVALQ